MTCQGHLLSAFFLHVFFYLHIHALVYVCAASRVTPWL